MKGLDIRKVFLAVFIWALVLVVMIVVMLMMVEVMKLMIKIIVHWISLVTQLVKNLPAMRETWVQSLGWEDPLEEGMAIHSSITAWRIPLDRGAWRTTIHGVTESDATE